MLRYVYSYLIAKKKLWNWDGFWRGYADIFSSSVASLYVNVRISESNVSQG